MTVSVFDSECVSVCVLCEIDIFDRYFGYEFCKRQGNWFGKRQERKSELFVEGHHSTEVSKRVIMFLRH